MTTRRFNRRARNPVRRSFGFQTGTTGTIGSATIDLTLQAVLAAEADSRTGDVLITGLALVDAADEAAIHQCLCWVSRVSTEPAQEDTGVRTRQFAANAQGLPFVLRFRGMRVNPGELLKILIFPIVETLATITHQDIVSTKWTFREMRQG